MSRLPMKSSLALVALTAVIGVASADDFWGAAPKNTDDSETKVLYLRWMAEADALAIEVGRFLNDPPQSTFEYNRMSKRYRGNVERAVKAYEKAIEARPDAPEPYYRAAELLYRHKLDRPINSPVMRDRDWAERALDHWDRFEALAPLDPRVTETHFRRALVYTKMADEDSFKRAIGQYETLLRHSDLHSLSAFNANVWLGNLAETYMMVGRLDDAIATYKRALDFADKPVTAYGLAVALDRAEHGVHARETMRAYAEYDNMRGVLEGDVFFVPQGEVDYYLALGFESLGQLDKARKHYQAFIASGAHPRYQGRARQNLEWVEAEMARQKKRGHTPTLPRGLGL